jgi:hypothetical protein
MADLCVDGSIIVQDFYSKAFLSGEISKFTKRNMSMIERMGELWKFGINMSNDPNKANSVDAKSSAADSRRSLLKKRTNNEFPQIYFEIIEQTIWIIRRLDKPIKIGYYFD